MLKKIKMKWQAYLDGSSRPMFEEAKKSKVNGPDFFASPEIVWTPDRVDMITSAERAVRRRSTVSATLRELRAETAPVATIARPLDTRGMGPIARELMAEFELTYTRLLAEKMRAQVWRGAMFARRSLRNQSQVLVDVEHLWRDDVPEQQLVAGGVDMIMRRALVASDTEAPTGLIPRMAPAYAGTEEEPYA